jgi:hypothetical protein
MSKKKKKKKVKISEKPRFYGQSKLFSSHPALQSLGSFTTRLHDLKKELNIHFEQNFTTGSYGVRIGLAWCFQKACEICSSLV